MKNFVSLLFGAIIGFGGGCIFGDDVKNALRDMLDETTSVVDDDNVIIGGPSFPGDFVPQNPTFTEPFPSRGPQE